MITNPLRRFGCLANLATVSLFAALGWGALCYDSGYAEFQAFCEGGKTRILQKISRILSYVDATGNGCSAGCQKDLRDRVVEFVEVQFDPIESERSGLKNDTVVPQPKTAGLYRVHIKVDEPPCLRLFESAFRHDPGLNAYCFEYAPNTALTSRYEYKETQTEKFRSMGIFRGFIYQIRDRQTGDVIASRGHGGYEGTAMRFMPFAAYQQSCGDDSLRISEIMSPS